jgi:hypothetical protein
MEIRSSVGSAVRLLVTAPVTVPLCAVGFGLRLTEFLPLPGLTGFVPLLGHYAVHGAKVIAGRPLPGPDGVPGLSYPDRPIPGPGEY